MNYDLALMALEGLARSPLKVRVEGNDVVIDASSASFRELARLCLLLGGDATASAEGFDLKPGLHTDSAGHTLRLRLTD